MVVIVTRAGKGAPLTNAEVDANFINLNAGVVAAPGDVVGPAGATDNNIARFDGATGKLVQTASAKIEDDGRLWLFDAGSINISSNLPASQQRNILQWVPPGAGPGQPLFSIDSIANSDIFQMGTWDGTGSSGTIRFAVAQVVINGVLDSTHIRPGVTGSYDVGSAALRYRTVFGIDGDFSGSFYAAGNITAGGSITTTAGISVGYISLTGASNALAIGPRDGSGTTFQWYNPTGDYLGVHTGAAQVFSIAANGDVTATGYISTGSSIIGGSVYASGGVGVGYVSINPGSAGNSGSIQFFDPAAARIGYIGYSDSPSKTITLTAEGGYKYRFGEGFSTGGDFFLGAAKSIYLRANPSDNNSVVAFRNEDGSYLIYDWIGGQLTWVQGGAARFQSQPNGDFTVWGDLIFGGGNRPEPRGRYWSRPAPSGNYTITPADAGALIVCVAGAPMTITIAPQSAGAFPLNARIDIVQYNGAGVVSFAPGAGVGLNSNGGKRRIAGAYLCATLLQINPDDWLLVGDIMA